jgi:predicted enzyme related to lactoylglutathione lyase
MRRQQVQRAAAVGVALRHALSVDRTGTGSGRAGENADAAVVGRDLCDGESGNAGSRVDAELEVLANFDQVQCAFREHQIVAADVVGSVGRFGTSTILPTPLKTRSMRIEVARTTRSPDTPVAMRNPRKPSAPEVWAEAGSVGPASTRPAAASRATNASPARTSSQSGSTSLRQRHFFLGATDCQSEDNAGMRIEFTLDCTDLGRTSRFWSEAAGLRVDGRIEDRYMSLSGHGVSLTLQRVAEPKTVKNRLHIDLLVEEPEQEVHRLESLGASRLTPVARREFGQTWFVLADPEGNEFCVAAELHSSSTLREPGTECSIIAGQPSVGERHISCRCRCGADACGWGHTSTLSAGSG